MRFFSMGRLPAGLRGAGGGPAGLPAGRSHGGAARASRAPLGDGRPRRTRLRQLPRRDARHRGRSAGALEPAPGSRRGRRPLRSGRPGRQPHRPQGRAGGRCVDRRRPVQHGMAGALGRQPRRGNGRREIPENAAGADHAPGFRLPARGVHRSVLGGLLARGGGAFLRGRLPLRARATGTAGRPHRADPDGLGRHPGGSLDQPRLHRRRRVPDAGLRRMGQDHRRPRSRAVALPGPAQGMAGGGGARESGRPPAARETRTAPAAGRPVDARRALQRHGGAARRATPFAASSGTRARPTPRPSALRSTGESSRL